MTDRLDDDSKTVASDNRSEDAGASGDLILKLGITSSTETGDRSESKTRTIRETKLSRKRAPEPSFEQSIQQLSQIVEQLESGDLPLESSVKMFEQGMEIVKRCDQQLKQASKKVEKLLSVDDDGTVQTEPFEV